MITFKVDGGFTKTFDYLRQLKQMDVLRILEKYGQRGVELLFAATPKDSSTTANSWSYKVKKTSKGYSLEWHNANVVNGVNIAVILFYGHETRNGGHVQGIDYINPTLLPLFNDMIKELEMEVKRI